MLTWGRQHRTQLLRVWRYGVTSIVATGVSELTLILVYSSGLLGASTAAIVASLAGVVPSYPMSRYWIWPEAGRQHMGRQVTSYVLLSIVSLIASSVLTGVAAANAPSGHRAHVIVVALAYIGTYGLLWLAKFAIYQRFLFRGGNESSPQ
jgi:putative flippase GtrA